MSNIFIKTEFFYISIILFSTKTRRNKMSKENETHVTIKNDSFMLMIELEIRCNNIHTICKYNSACKILFDPDDIIKHINDNIEHKYKIIPASSDIYINLYTQNGKLRININEYKRNTWDVIDVHLDYVLDKERVDNFVNILLDIKNIEGWNKPDKITSIPWF